jgi:hypothetical protein
MKSIKNYISLVEDDTGYGALDLAKDAGAGAAGMAVVGKELGTKQLAKMVPGLGSGLALKNAWDRFQKGDRTGAVISALAAAGYLIPGPGGWTLGGMGDAANVGRDIQQWYKDNQTKKDVKEDFNMNSVDQIKAIRTKLAQIDEQFAPKAAAIGAEVFPTVTNIGKQGLDDLLARYSAQAGLKGAASSADDIGRAATSKVEPSADELIKQIPTGRTPSNNNVAKSAAALAAAGGLALYGARPDGSTNTPGGKPGGKPGGIAANPAAAGAGGLSPEEEQELALLADKLGKHMGRNPDVDKLLLRHTKLRGNGGIPNPGGDSGAKSAPRPAKS